MKQYRRGIKAYQSASTGALVKTTPVVDKPETKQGLIKTTVEEDKFVRVAKFLLALGKEEASKVISHLPAEDIEKVSLEITKIDRVGKSEAYNLLKEFGKDISSYNRNQGGVETARSILVSAFGQKKGNNILYKAVPDSQDTPFAFLADLDFKQRMMILRKESVSVLTIILHFLPAKLASPILESLPPEQQKDLVRRLAKLKRVSPEVIGLITENLTEKIKKLGTKKHIDIDGSGTLADILKHMDRDDEKLILEEINNDNPALCETIKDRLYTIDIIHNIDPKDFQKVIHELSDQELIYLIRGESHDIQNRIWDSMSDGRRLLVESEMELTGLVKKSDADKMTKSFIELIHRKKEKGELRILSEDDLIY